MKNYKNMFTCCIRVYREERGPKSVYFDIDNQVFVINNKKVLISKTAIVTRDNENYSPIPISEVFTSIVGFETNFTIKIEDIFDKLSKPKKVIQQQIIKAYNIYKENVINGKLPKYESEVILYLSDSNYIIYPYSIVYCINV